MKALHFLLLCSLGIVMINCKNDDDSPDNIYENCCVEPPVERNFHPGKVYIPNIFTPNADGINDIFWVYADEDIEQVREFRILDHEGRLIYEFYNYPPNNIVFGWFPYEDQMTTHKGVFDYFVKVQNIDGDEFEIEGTICAFVCEEGNPAVNFENCGFPFQHNGDGEFDPTSYNGGEECP